MINTERVSRFHQEVNKEGTCNPTPVLRFGDLLLYPQFSLGLIRQVYVPHHDMHNRWSFYPPKMARSQVCTSWHERHGTLQQSRGTAAFVSSTCYLDVKLSFLRPGWLSMSRCCSPWLLLPRSYLWSMWMVWCTGTLAAPWLVSIPTEFGRHAQRGVRAVTKRRSCQCVLFVS